MRLAGADTLFAAAFPSKLAIGDWSVLVAARDRTENVPASVARDDLPSGDDAFPPHYLERRLAFVDVACDAMDRMGVVWPVGKKVRSRAPTEALVLPHSRG